MELYQLRAFIAVAEHGQLHRASEQLHATLSALSKQIKSLESELGVLLFERTREGMQLTAAGRHLLTLALQVTRSAQQMNAVAASIRGQVVGTLRVGTILDPETIRLGPLMSELLRLCPHVDVTLVHGVSGTLHEQLRRGELDACFYLGMPRDPQVAMKSLCLEHYVVVAPIGWRERLSSATWEDLADMPWVAASSSGGTLQGELMGRILAQRSLTCRAVVHADHEVSRIGLMLSGIGLTLVRERVALPMSERGQAVVWHGARLPCPLSLLYRRTDTERDVVQALLGVLPTVWQGSPASESGQVQQADNTDAS